MPSVSSADTIRILVATDSHVGYNERDPIRGDDSWKSFHEVMCLAKDRDVDMILLAGDLFHDNQPTRKSMYQVMRSLRMNCYGEKPCELEILSDSSENFPGAFSHVNYEDPDINIAIPVFSIHGNHDDPSGEGHLAALDLLQISGLVNYYGRTPESDNILLKPVLLQKGLTKLALYGMSNVRDERLFRTFRDGKVKVFQPGTQKQDWFNLMSVHQNHHAYTETGYLPENFLPEFMDLVVWGHEHECLIDPRYNPEMNFHVMQPGSSVATSLMPGEAVPKHVAILNITGREFKAEKIRLKTVRPFLMKEIVLSDQKEITRLAKKENHRTDLTRYLISVVDDLIKQANADWLEAQEESVEESDEEKPGPPLPLIRLRVEYSAPNGGSFDCENPQRFSNRFVSRVANVNDVIQFYRKKANSTVRKAGQNAADLPEESVLAQLTLDSVKVERLVREFLTAQSLTILPQNSFGDAVGQFVDKDDKHAMEMFVNESLSNQISHLLKVDQGNGGRDPEDEDLQSAMDSYKSKLEELFAKGHLNKARKARIKPKPDYWDSDLDGSWADQPGALARPDEDFADEEEDAASVLPSVPATKGKASKAVSSAAAKKTPAAPKTPGKTTARGRKKAIISDDDDNNEEDANEDIIMLSDAISDDDNDATSLFLKPDPPHPASKAPRKTTASQGSKRATPASRGAAAAAAITKSKAKQATLDFSQSQTNNGTTSTAKTTAKTKAKAKAKLEEISDDDEDDEDAFEPAVPVSTRSSRSRR